MAKFDFDKPVASFSWYLQNGSADDKRGNRLHVGTGQKAQIYFDPESGEFIGKLKYVDDYIDLADGAKQHFELPRTAREYKPSDFSPKFPISNVKFEVDESVKDFIHVLPRGLFFYQNEFYDAVFGDKTDYPESLKDFLFTRTGDIEAAGEFYGAIEKWPQSVYGTLVEKCNVENRPIPEYENDRVLPLDYHKELLASLKDHFGCGESNYRTPGDLIAARSYGSYLSGISLKFNPQDVIAAVEHATETVQAELVPYAVCRNFEPMSQEQVIERDRQMAAEQAAREARLQFMNAREKEFEQKFGCNPSSVLAYEAVHPEMCTRFIARRKKTEMISYRLPAEAVKAGMKEEQVCPLAYARHSRVSYFDVFMQGTGKKRHWEDVDFEALTENFDKAAEKGKRAKMQPKARLDAKKTCVDEAMRMLQEQTDISGDKEQENQNR